MKRLSPCLALAFILVAVTLCFPWSGKCVGIADGDTIRVMHKGKAEKIRLYGIDSPERGRHLYIEMVPITTGVPH